MDQGTLLKIHEGTAKGTDDLCRSCAHASIRRSVEGHELRICGVNGSFGRWPILTHRITTCTAFHNTKMPLLHELREIAWEITTPSDGTRGTVGFISPEERRKAGIGFSGPPHRY